VEYGSAVIPDGFFLKRLDEPEPVKRYADGEGTFFRHLSTFPERSTVKEAVLDLLGQARQHVFFCNFLLQDEEVLQALLAAARRLSGHVYILTTLKADDFAQGGGAGDDAEGDFESHMRCIKQLTREGLLIKARSDCHAKFMTVDDAQAIVTSANAVPTCYGNVRKPKGGQRDANPENGVLFTTRGEVRRLANFFRALWRDACNYYVAPDPTMFEVQQVQSGTPPVRPAEPPRPAEEGEVLWTSPGDLRILRRFLGMVQAARHKVFLSTWVMKGMDGHELGDAIRKAATRGVQFRILVRGMNWRDDHRRQCYLLARALGRNSTILGDFWNHSKAVVMDSEEAMVLTANMDAQHGLDHGVEMGFHSRQPSFVTAVSGFLNRLAADAAFEFVPDPTQAAMAERYGRQRGQQLGGMVRVRFQPKGGHISRLVRQWCDAAGRELVRVAKRQAKGREEILLLTNRMAIYARPGDSGALVAHYINDKPPTEDLDRFDSYLGSGTVVCEVAGS
jgi:phosphatidylserine/phosphatidylglycerophosphate/cardiolipin synthase-like enzyme